MPILKNILIETASITVEMAPYLLFGFLMAGILSVFISRDYVKRHLGGTGFKAAFKAALLGVPMPICSCGVIPLASSLRKQGASRGATASFLASTPQTGIDSLMITYALMGWLYALFRAVVAFISGILCGIAVEAIPAKPEEPVEELTSDKKSKRKPIDVIKHILTYGLLDLPKSVSRSMMIGIILSGVISGLIPENYFADRMGNSIVTMFIMLGIGIPLYICSSGSVPIALAFIKAGISPGASLIFLITGPATNAATLTTLWEMMGLKQLIIFLLTLCTCALAAGFIMNGLDLHLQITEYTQCHTDEKKNLFEILCAVLLVALLLRGLIPSKGHKTH